jgi:DNA-binding CsgD family transcriptional regulator
MTITSTPHQRPRLTDREATVLDLLARGLTAAAIGRRLGISSRTVHRHQGHLYRKLQVSDRLVAVLRAQALGLLNPPADQRPTWMNGAQKNG